MECDGAAVLLFGTNEASCHLGEELGGYGPDLPNSASAHSFRALTTVAGFKRWKIADKPDPKSDGDVWFLVPRKGDRPSKRGDQPAQPTSSGQMDESKPIQPATQLPETAVPPSTSTASMLEGAASLPDHSTPVSTDWPCQWYSTNAMKRVVQAPWGCSQVTYSACDCNCPLCSTADPPWSSQATYSYDYYPSPVAHGARFEQEESASIAKATEGCYSVRWDSPYSTAVVPAAATVPATATAPGSDASTEEPTYSMLSHNGPRPCTGNPNLDLCLGLATTDSAGSRPTGVSLFGALIYRTQI